MKNLMQIKHTLLKDFNEQNIYINVIEDSTSNLLIKNASIEIENNTINFYNSNSIKFSINLKDVIKIKYSHFKIIFYFEFKQIEVEI